MSLLFEHHRSFIEKVFLELPSPTPKLQNMREYYDSGNACFMGECRVQMADGSMRPIQELKYGDQVRSLDGKVATVLCLVRTDCENQSTALVQVGDLYVTPFHPIKVNNQWTFPSYVASMEIYECPAVFNLVLDKHHVIMVESVECVTLGHDFSSDPVLKHPFFGSQKITQALSECSGWKEGYVRLPPRSFLRDSETNLIIGLKPVLAY